VTANANRCRKCDVTLSGFSKLIIALFLSLPISQLPTYLPISNLCGVYLLTYIPSTKQLPTYQPTYQVPNLRGVYLHTYQVPTNLPTYQPTCLTTYLPSTHLRGVYLPTRTYQVPTNIPTYEPTCLPVYLPTYLVLTYVVSTNLPTYLQFLQYENHLTARSSSSL